VSYANTIGKENGSRPTPKCLDADFSGMVVQNQCLASNGAKFAAGIYASFCGLAAGNYRKIRNTSGRLAFEWILSGRMGQTTG
jgi:hypothetical protein